MQYGDYASDLKLQHFVFRINQKDTGVIVQRSVAQLESTHAVVYLLIQESKERQKKIRKLLD